MDNELLAKKAIEFIKIDIESQIAVLEAEKKKLEGGGSIFSMSFNSVEKTEIKISALKEALKNANNKVPSATNLQEYLGDAKEKDSLMYAMNLSRAKLALNTTNSATNTHKHIIEPENIFAIYLVNKYFDNELVALNERAIAGYIESINNLENNKNEINTAGKEIAGETNLFNNIEDLETFKEKLKERLIYYQCLNDIDLIKPDDLSSNEDPNETITQLKLKYQTKVANLNIIKNAQVGGKQESLLYKIEEKELELHRNYFKQLTSLIGNSKQDHDIYLSQMYFIVNHIDDMTTVDEQKKLNGIKEVITSFLDKIPSEFSSFQSAQEIQQILESSNKTCKLLERQLDEIKDQSNESLVDELKGKVLEKKSALESAAESQQKVISAKVESIRSEITRESSTNLQSISLENLKSEYSNLKKDINKLYEPGSFGGDSSKESKAIKEVLDNSLRNLEKQFKAKAKDLLAKKINDVKKNFNKLSEVKSQAGLDEKGRELESEIETLKAAYNAVLDENEISALVSPMQTEVNASIKSRNDEFKSVKQAASKAIEDLSEKVSSSYDACKSTQEVDAKKSALGDKLDLLEGKLVNASDEDRPGLKQQVETVKASIESKSKEQVKKLTDNLSASISEPITPISGSDKTEIQASRRLCQQKIDALETKAIGVFGKKELIPAKLTQAIKDKRGLLDSSYKQARSARVEAISQQILKSLKIDLPENATQTELGKYKEEVEKHSSSLIAKINSEFPESENKSVNTRLLSEVGLQKERLIQVSSKRENIIKHAEITDGLSLDLKDIVSSNDFDVIDKKRVEIEKSLALLKEKAESLPKGKLRDDSLSEISKKGKEVQSAFESKKLKLQTVSRGFDAALKNINKKYSTSSENKEDFEGRINAEIEKAKEFLHQMGQSESGSNYDKLDSAIKAVESRRLKEQVTKEIESDANSLMNDDKHFASCNSPDELVTQKDKLMVKEVKGLEGRIKDAVPVDKKNLTKLISEVEKNIENKCKAKARDLLSDDIDGVKKKFKVISNVTSQVGLDEKGRESEVELDRLKKAYKDVLDENEINDSVDPMETEVNASIKSRNDEFESVKQEVSQMIISLLDHIQTGYGDCESAQAVEAKKTELSNQLDSIEKMLVNASDEDRLELKQQVQTARNLIENKANLQSFNLLLSSDEVNEPVLNNKKSSQEISEQYQAKIDKINEEAEPLIAGMSETDKAASTKVLNDSVKALESSRETLLSDVKKEILAIDSKFKVMNIKGAFDGATDADSLEKARVQVNEKLDDIVNDLDAYDGPDKQRLLDSVSKKRQEVSNAVDEIKQYISTHEDIISSKKGSIDNAIPQEILNFTTQQEYSYEALESLREKSKEVNNKLAKNSVSIKKFKYVSPSKSNTDAFNTLGNRAAVDSKLSEKYNSAKTSLTKSVSSAEVNLNGKKQEILKEIVLRDESAQNLTGRLKAADKVTVDNVSQSSIAALLKNKKMLLDVPVVAKEEIGKYSKEKQREIGRYQQSISSKLQSVDSVLQSKIKAINFELPEDETAEKLSSDLGSYESDYNELLNLSDSEFPFGDLERARESLDNQKEKYQTAIVAATLKEQLAIVSEIPVEIEGNDLESIESDNESKLSFFEKTKKAVLSKFDNNPPPEITEVLDKKESEIKGSFENKQKERVAINTEVARINNIDIDYEVGESLAELKGRRDEFLDEKLKKQPNVHEDVSSALDQRKIFIEEEISKIKSEIESRDALLNRLPQPLSGESQSIKEIEAHTAQSIAQIDTMLSNNEAFNNISPKEHEGIKQKANERKVEIQANNDTAISKLNNKKFNVLNDISAVRKLVSFSKLGKASAIQAHAQILEKKLDEIKDSLSDCAVEHESELSQKIKELSSYINTEKVKQEQVLESGFLEELGEVKTDVFSNIESIDEIDSRTKSLNANILDIEKRAKEKFDVKLPSTLIKAIEDKKESVSRLSQDRLNLFKSAKSNFDMAFSEAVELNDSKKEVLNETKIDSLMTTASKQTQHLSASDKVECESILSQLAGKISERRKSSQESLSIMAKVKAEVDGLLTNSPFSNVFTNNDSSNKPSANVVDVKKALIEHLDKELSKLKDIPEDDKKSLVALIDSKKRQIEEASQTISTYLNELEDVKGKLSDNLSEIEKKLPEGSDKIENLTAKELDELEQKLTEQNKFIIPAQNTIEVKSVDDASLSSALKVIPIKGRIKNIPLKDIYNMKGRLVSAGSAKESQILQARNAIQQRRDVLAEEKRIAQLKAEESTQIESSANSLMKDDKHFASCNSPDELVTQKDKLMVEEVKRLEERVKDAVPTDKDKLHGLISEAKSNIENQFKAKAKDLLAEQINDVKKNFNKLSEVKSQAGLDEKGRELESEIETLKAAYNAVLDEREISALVGPMETEVNVSIENRRNELKSIKQEVSQAIDDLSKEVGTGYDSCKSTQEVGDKKVELSDKLSGIEEKLVGASDEDRPALQEKVTALKTSIESKAKDKKTKINNNFNVAIQENLNNAIGKISVDIDRCSSKQALQALQSSLESQCKTVTTDMGALEKGGNHNTVVSELGHRLKARKEQVQNQIDNLSINLKSAQDVKVDFSSCKDLPAVKAQAQSIKKQISSIEAKYKGQTIPPIIVDNLKTKKSELVSKLADKVKSFNLESEFAAVTDLSATGANSLQAVNAAVQEQLESISLDDDGRLVDDINSKKQQLTTAVEEVQSQYKQIAGVSYPVSSNTSSIATSSVATLESLEKELETEALALKVLKSEIEPVKPSADTITVLGPDSKGPNNALKAKKAEVLLAITSRLGSVLVLQSQVKSLVRVKKELETNLRMIQSIKTDFNACNDLLAIKVKAQSARSEISAIETTLPAKYPNGVPPALVKALTVKKADLVSALAAKVKDLTFNNTFDSVTDLSAISGANSLEVLNASIQADIVGLKSVLPNDAGYDVVELSTAIDDKNSQIQNAVSEVRKQYTEISASDSPAITDTADYANKSVDELAALEQSLEDDIKRLTDLQGTIEAIKPSAATTNILGSNTTGPNQQLKNKKQEVLNAIGAKLQEANSIKSQITSIKDKLSRDADKLMSTLESIHNNSLDIKNCPYQELMDRQVQLKSKVAPEISAADRAKLPTARKEEIEKLEGEIQTKLSEVEQEILDRPKTAAFLVSDIEQLAKIDSSKTFANTQELESHAQDLVERINEIAKSDVLEQLSESDQDRVSNTALYAKAEINNFVELFKKINDSLLPDYAGIDNEAAIKQKSDNEKSQLKATFDSKIQLLNTENQQLLTKLYDAKIAAIDNSVNQAVTALAPATPEITLFGHEESQSIGDFFSAKDNNQKYDITINCAHNKVTFSGAEIDDLKKEEGYVLKSDSGQKFEFKIEKDVPKARLAHAETQIQAGETQAQADERTAMTIITMIDNVVANGGEVNVNTANPLTAQIAANYINFLRKDADSLSFKASINGSIDFQNLTTPENRKHFNCEALIEDPFNRADMAFNHIMDAQVKEPAPKAAGGQAVPEVLKKYRDSSKFSDQSQWFISAKAKIDELKSAPNEAATPADEGYVSSADNRYDVP